MAEPVITHTLLRICARLLQTGRKESCYSMTQYLEKISETNGDVVWQTLRRMEEHGWLRSDLETVNQVSQSRPPRRLYQFTEPGKTKARKLLQDLQVQA